MSQIVRPSFGIIGCGIIGLSVATIVQDRYPDSRVTIYSENTNELTTSWGAAGFLRYNKNNFEETSDLYQTSWFKKSANHFWNLYRSEDCVESGVLLSNFYEVSESVILLPENCQSLYEGMRVVNERELRAVGFPSRFKHGISFISTLTESRYYLKYLTSKFERNGGKIIRHKLSGGSSSVADLALEKGYDVIVNCSGLGSRELFGDNTVIPMRGQLLRVDAPWMKYSFLTDDDTYAYCGKESMILGGIRQKNDWELSPRSKDTTDILRRIKEHNVCLGNSKIIEEWVGLRPWRPKLRLEIEYISSSDGLSVPVVHNYGHGSSGIGLSWGTSMVAVDLIDTLIHRQIKSKL